MRWRRQQPSPAAAPPEPLPPAPEHRAAVVLSGGGVNAVMLEGGFLKRLSESSLWPQVGFVFGTSAGALAGFMAALDRIDELETFLLGLQPQEIFAPQRLWRTPLSGFHEFALMRTVEQRIGPLDELAHELAGGQRELVVVTSDITPSFQIGEPHRAFETAFSSRQTPPREMGQAVFASAAISLSVPPFLIDGRVLTDGGWVRHFPLAYAYERPEVEQIVAFQYLPGYKQFENERLRAWSGRAGHLARVPVGRNLSGALRDALDRAEDGVPAHLADTFARLTRNVVVRNSLLEEMHAAEKDASISELARLEQEVATLVAAHVPGREREQALAAVAALFAQAQFPFRHDRLVPRLTVTGDVDRVSLDPGFRKQQPWTVEEKRAVFDRGYQLADAALADAGIR